MTASFSPVYEIVTAQILLSRRHDFLRLHKEVLTPMLQRAGIETVLQLLTEVGDYLRFVDIYKYESLQDYGERTDSFLENPELSSYYQEVGQCIQGSIQVQLAREFPS